MALRGIAWQQFMGFEWEVGTGKSSWGTESTWRSGRKSEPWGGVRVVASFQPAGISRILATQGGAGVPAALGQELSGRWTEDIPNKGMGQRTPGQLHRSDDMFRGFAVSSP